MNYKLIKSETKKNIYELEVKLTAEEWKNEVEAAYNKNKGKYNIEGFLHYALCYIGEGDATGVINPYVEQSGNKCFPAGDTFCIYPTTDGGFLESIRLCIIRDAFQDIRAMQLLEGYVGHDEVVRVIEEELGTELRFDVCAKSAETIINIRERINRMIKDIVKEI